MRISMIMKVFKNIFLYGFMGLFSFSSYGFLENKTQGLKYSGEGTLFRENEKNKNSKYQISMHLERISPKQVLVLQMYKMGDGENISSNYIVEEKSRYFYKLYDLQMLPIGIGYCFKLTGFNGKKCHYQFDAYEKQKSQIFTIKNNEIFRMGSEQTEGKVTVWRERLKLSDTLPTP